MTLSVQELLNKKRSKPSNIVLELYIQKLQIKNIIKTKRCSKSVYTSYNRQT